VDQKDRFLSKFNFPTPVTKSLTKPIRLTRLTPLPINAEIRSPKIFLRPSPNQPASVQQTNDILRHLAQINRSIIGTGSESFLVQISSGSASSSGGGNSVGQREQQQQEHPFCAVLTRDELRARARKQERREREFVRRERRAKELDMNWTVGDRDMRIQLARLVEFLNEEFKVTFNIVQPRRTAAVGQERRMEIVNCIREAVKEVQGLTVAEKISGELGKTMMMEFRPAAVPGTKSNAKVVVVQMPINAVALETKLTEIKASLRKGTNTKVTIEEPESDARVKNSLTEEEIWQRIRTIVRGVKDAVEPNMHGSDTRSKLFKAEYKRADLPRIIEIEPDLGFKMLDVRAQWVSTWLQKDIPVRTFVHNKQDEASGGNGLDTDSKLQRLVDTVQAATKCPVISTKEPEAEGSQMGVWYSMALSEQPVDIKPVDIKPIDIKPSRPQIDSRRQPIPQRQPLQQNRQSYMNGSYADVLHRMSQAGHS
jgi:translation initiation factor IF-3